MIRALIFDLCDTIVRTAGAPGLNRLPGVADRNHARRVDQWIANSAEFAAFECGKISSQIFLAAFRKGAGLCASDATLRRAFDRFVLHEIEGVAPLLRQLAAEYPLYALSNNNELLWRGVQRVCTALDVFERVFLSQEIGLLKPDLAAFRYALEQIGCQPREAVLIDDNPYCVAAAAALGMETVLFRDAAQTVRELAEILDSKHRV